MYILCCVPDYLTKNWARPTDEIECKLSGQKHNLNFKLRNGKYMDRWPSTLASVWSVYFVSLHEIIFHAFVQSVVGCDQCCTD